MLCRDSKSVTATGKHTGQMLQFGAGAQAALFSRLKAGALNVPC